jgi:hypothetical protein
VILAYQTQKQGYIRRYEAIRFIIYKLFLLLSKYPYEFIREITDLIGKLGFMMMGATNLVFDNQTNTLSWLMGSGALVKQYNLPISVGTIRLH